ncbi:hypothetical protein [Streptomyces liliifuscus]|uniref:Uncharacterized protein n=1 Tax=Streptomyces liliifuscus TaxID=2797636 RepID=A0A7T7KTC8_9ACTN|nr:hypothetical protein [Streptomyces liliifuscus]QQM38060.1 hypothetical protein JEQ17_00090 [Streptomyces liliifuscus]QQM46381.1 hypothetical protein JEQ17_47965 [Streptomyces liliifuscus]
MVGVAALMVSVVALGVSGWASLRQLRLAQHANTLPVLVDLFREHRSVRLAGARQFVHERLPGCDLSAGLDGVPEAERELVRELAWFYDNLGALVAHGVVDIEPVSGYLGGVGGLGVGRDAAAGGGGAGQEGGERHAGSEPLAGVLREPLPPGP